MGNSLSLRVFQLDYEGSGFETTFRPPRMGSRQPLPMCFIVGKPTDNSRVSLTNQNPIGARVGNDLAPEHVRPRQRRAVPDLVKAPFSPPIPYHVSGVDRIGDDLVDGASGPGPIVEARPLGRTR